MKKQLPPSFPRRRESSYIKDSLRSKDELEGIFNNTAGFPPARE